MVSGDVIKSEKGLRQMIRRNLEKEFHPGTKPSVDFIYKILEDAYERGMKYDVSDMSNAIFAFHSSIFLSALFSIIFNSDKVSKIIS